MNEPLPMEGNKWTRHLWATSVMGLPEPKLASHLPPWAPASCDCFLEVTPNPAWACPLPQHL
jgi:hypothetical protein